MLPANHPLRFELNDEVHARPPEALIAPLRLTYVAMISAAAARETEWQRVQALALAHGAPPPATGANHYSAQLGPLRLTWERHSEFSRYMFIEAAPSGPPFADDRVVGLPADWLTSLPGKLLVAARVMLDRASAEALDFEFLANEHFAGNALLGSFVAGGAATAITDLRVREDGFTRWMVFNRSMTARQTGRIVQRLLEIDTYRMLALMALPVARELAPHVTRYERDLAQITDALSTTGPADESALLDRLTRLEAEIDTRESQNHYRFGAAAAYYELVQRRIAELREERIEGLQMFQEFMERRLAPAMNTCRAVSTRQQSLSERVARATQLLSTRVGVTRESQNQAVLESMNRRGALQLRLQGTVEGLSVAAITYYIAGLVSYLAKGLEALHASVSPTLVTAVSIPVIAILVALGVRRVRRLVEHREQN